MNNVLTQVTQSIPSDLSDSDTLILLTESLSVIDFIYAYVIYKKDGLYDIKYMISETTEYNTINTRDAAIDINNIILNDKKHNICKKILGHKQPCKEILIEVLDPLINKLSSQMLRAWGTYYEYDDLCQICRLMMITLIDKGYYIHKSLLYKCFENYILCQLRSEKGKPTIVNFEEPAYQSGGGDDMEKLTVADIIPDKDDLLTEEDRVNKDAQMLIFGEIKEILIEFIGQRQYDQLLRDYYTGNTTSWSRRTMQRFKEHLAKLGITKEDFINKYYGGK